MRYQDRRKKEREKKQHLDENIIFVNKRKPELLFPVQKDSKTIIKVRESRLKSKWHLYFDSEEEMLNKLEQYKNLIK